MKRLFSFPILFLVLCTSAAYADFCPNQVVCSGSTYESCQTIGGSKDGWQYTANSNGIVSKTYSFSLAFAPNYPTSNDSIICTYRVKNTNYTISYVSTAFPLYTGIGVWNTMGYCTGPDPTYCGLSRSKNK